jgi:hypothetical protein
LIFFLNFYKIFVIFANKFLIGGGMNTPNERLRAIIEHTGGNITQFVDKLNAMTNQSRTRQWFNHYLNNPTSTLRDLDLLNAIRELGYNTDWYIYGSGEMRIDNKFKMPIIDISDLPKLSFEDRMKLLENAERITKMIQDYQTLYNKYGD